MTELHTDNMPRPRPVWPWVLTAAVILALAIWWALSQNDPDRTVADTAGEGVVADAGAIGLPTAVDLYVRFVDSVRATDAMAPDHEYTSTGIRHLAAAVEAVGAAGGADISRELTALREQADTLERDPGSTDHAAYTRKAFVSLAALMRAVQQVRFPQLEAEVASVRSAAEKLRADQRLLEQRESVQAFFDEAAAAIRRMSASTT